MAGGWLGWTARQSPKRCCALVQRASSEPLTRMAVALSILADVLLNVR